jgi:hypothetical protein
MFTKYMNRTINSGLKDTLILVMFLPYYTHKYVDCRVDPWHSIYENMICLQEL